MTRGKALQAGGVAGYMLGALMMFAAGDMEKNPEWLNALPVFMAAALSHFIGRQLVAQARTASADSPIHDDRPDVLYLRSFETDASTIRKQVMAGFSSAEEDLAEAVRPLGDMVAVGKPGESLPVPGAARMYCSDDSWQDTVLKRMREAPLVIIRAGRSGGLVWECEQAFATVAPSRLVILILDLKASDYDAFAAGLRALNIRLPLVPRFSALDSVRDWRNNPSKVTSGFIVFSDGWRADFVPLKLRIVKFGYRELVRPYREALRQVFVTNGALERL